MLPPFDKWPLPPRDAVCFEVKHRRDVYGEFWPEPPTILISSVHTGQFESLCRVMAHEMIHLVQELAKEATGAQHNAAFRRRSRQVCKVFGWDNKAF